MNNLGVSLERQGRKKEAIERYHDAARLSPTDKRVQRNLKRTLTSYVGGGFALIWLVAQAVRLFSTGLEARGWGLLALLPLLAIVVIVAFWLKRRRRLKELHPTVQAFYAGERTRERKQLPLQIAFLVTFVVALGWTLVVVLSQDIRRSSGPVSWSIYALVLAGAVACTTQIVRRATAERRRLRD
jgi:cobalamin synthase